MLRVPIITTMSYFGERLKEALAAKGISQYRLFKLSGVPESSISKIIKTGKRPTDEIIKKFQSVETIGLSEEVMLEWRMVDDYPDQAAEYAEKKETLELMFEYETHDKQIELLKEYFDGMSKKDQLDFIRSKFHLVDEVKKIDAESEGKTN